MTSGVDCDKDGRLANALAQAISAETEVLRSIEFSLNDWCLFPPSTGEVLGIIIRCRVRDCTMAIVNNRSLRQPN